MAMQSKATTVTEYLKGLDPDRKKAITAIRKVIKANLDPKVKETMTYGMIGYVVPLNVYPDGYHCNPETPLPFANLASQKAHMGIYLFCIYGNPEEKARLEKEWKATGKKLDMGKSCIRVKKLEDVPLDVLGAAVKRMTVAKFIEQYERDIPASARKKAAKKVAKKPAAKKASKKVTAKAAAKKAAKKTAKKTTKKVAKKAAGSTKKVVRKAAKKKAVRKKSS